MGKGAELRPPKRGSVVGRSDLLFHWAEASQPGFWRSTEPGVPLNAQGQKEAAPRNSLAVQWLGLRASTVWGAGSIPGQGTKIPQGMAWPKKPKNNKTAPQSSQTSL